MKTITNRKVLEAISGGETCQCGYFAEGLETFIETKTSTAQEIEQACIKHCCNKSDPELKQVNGPLLYLFGEEEKNCPSSSRSKLAALFHCCHS